MGDKSHLLIKGLNDIFSSYRQSLIEEALGRMLIMGVDRLELILKPTQELVDIGVKGIVLTIISDSSHNYFHYALVCDTRVLDYDVIKHGAVDGAIVGSGLIRSTCIMKVNVVERYGYNKFDVDIVNLFASSFIDLQVGLSSLDFKAYKKLTIKLYDTMVRYFVLDKNDFIYSFRNLSDDVFKDKTIDFCMDIRVLDKEDMKETSYMLKCIFGYVHIKGINSRLYLKSNVGSDMSKGEQVYDGFLRCLRSVGSKEKKLTLILDTKYKEMYKRWPVVLECVCGRVEFQQDLDKSNLTLILDTKYKEMYKRWPVVLECVCGDVEFQ